MENDRLSMLDVLIETHIGLERQGPGSSEMTVKALGFIDAIDSIEKVADMGCGTGSQTLLLAQHVAGTIIGLDQFPGFIDVLNERAEHAGLKQRVSGIVGSMDDLPFSQKEFDLIWSEGAIDAIGFERGIRYWKDFLKPGGYIAVTCPSWFTGKHPEEVGRFWTDAGSALDPIDHNVAVMEKAGYAFIAAFALPEACWTDSYFTPRRVAEVTLLEKHPKSEALKESMENSRIEEALYTRYKQHYGYAFYIARKL